MAASTGYSWQFDRSSAYRVRNVLRCGPGLIDLCRKEDGVRLQVSADGMPKFGPLSRE